MVGAKFSWVEDHQLFFFQSKVDCAIVKGGPWFVACQLLAVEPWMPDFMPGANVVRRMMVWIRLPGLPIEY